MSYILKCSIGEIESILEDVDSYYHSWNKIKLDKDSGNPIVVNGTPSRREINAVSGKLKSIQRSIYKFLLSRIEFPDYVYGGVVGKSNIKNAKRHQGNKYIFTTDLRAFFPRISHHDVFKLYCKLGCTPTVARYLTKLTTYKYQLPQGAPTSTFLANLVFVETGDKLMAFCEEHEILFTIFVDDLTFSSKRDFKSHVSEILAILREDGYVISNNKTAYQTRNPVITGIICQNNRLKLKNSFHKRLAKLEHSNRTLEKDFMSKRIRGLRQYKKNVKSAKKFHRGQSAKKRLDVLGLI